jgi:threonine dehydrogenase-like Zn-dependent dehydrogenase
MGPDNRLGSASTCSTTRLRMPSVIGTERSDPSRVDTVPDPTIQDPRDVVIKITTTAICGSDLHLFNGFQPTMEKGDVLGHENMGEIVAVGSGVSTLKIGDRIVVPFTICCGECFFCQKGLFSCCDRTNPNAEMAKAVMGQSPAGLFGFSHMMGGYAGGQAEYLRVPYADVAPIKIPDGIPDEKVLFLSDIFPTGYMAAENCGIEPGYGGGPCRASTSGSSTRSPSARR